MVDKFDITRINAKPIEWVAERLGLKVTKHRAICPFHDDTRPSLMFHVRRNRFRCFVCGSNGGPIDLVMKVTGLNFRKACQWLDNGSASLGYTPVAPVQNHDRPEPKPDIAYLSRLMAQPLISQLAGEFLYEERAITQAVARKIGLSSIAYSCPMGSAPDSGYFDGPALLIPYRDMDGNLVSVQSRYLGTADKPRFRFPKGSSCHIFNLPTIKELGPCEPLFITEGVTDCLALLSAGYKAIAVPSATLLKPEDALILRGLNTHMYPDHDEPGERLFLQLRGLLPDIVHHTLPAGYKDIGQYWASLHHKSCASVKCKV